MADLRFTVTTVVRAPAHAVYEYCLDPRHIYAGDPMYRVVGTSVSDGGVGTTATAVTKVLVLTEEVAISYLRAEPDRRLVFEARPALLVAGRRLGSEVLTWTWVFAPKGDATTVTVSVENRGGGRWERALDALGTKKLMVKQTTERLARIKAATEARAHTA
ncbi:MAG: SRPBCC family protein [Angustibacter sp.]